MTDKQIINGVDVGWCKNYNNANSKDCETLYVCNKNPNCYYKQLKRKEQECERLKAKCKKYGEINEQETKDYAELKAENEELRKNLVDKHTSRCFRLVTHREFDKLIMETVQLRQENKKLKQTLTEIKEFFNEECIICKENYINITGEICEECKYKDILQKISECEGNDEIHSK